MKVVGFQLQTREGNLQSFYKIDPSAPIAQPLEGGDGQGPVYQCVLALEKVDELKALCEKNPYIRIYTPFKEFELDNTLYRSDFNVEWRFLKNPVVLASKQAKHES